MREFKDLSQPYSSAVASETKPSRPSPEDTPFRPKEKVRSIFISDVHLGTKDCKASELNDFLKHYSCQNLFLVGDIFDGWKISTVIYWKNSFNRVIRRLLKLSKQGINVYYITGNHDEFLRKYANNRFENIQIVNRYTHLTADNKKLLIIHGDQFESVTHCSKFWKFVGDFGYDILMSLNRWHNFCRNILGFGNWSLSAFLKKNNKTARNYISNYEKAVAYGAGRQGYDGVVCGHIHHAALKEIDGVHYYNTGDWVESCTAISESFNGEMKLHHWLNEPGHHMRMEKKKRRKQAHKKAARAQKQQEEV